ncbi:MAG: hypothetical protein FJ100_20835 [Deltaproteobacteria bacterium]|nr:hypothetical protein [Deltaproteobacteria bacterium]
MRDGAAAATLLVASPALACSVCAGAARDNGASYLWATAIMLGGPIALVAGFAWWIRRAALTSESASERR